MFVDMKADMVPRVEVHGIKIVPIMDGNSSDKMKVTDVKVINTYEVAIQKRDAALEVFRELKRNFCMDVKAGRFTTWSEAAPACEAVRQAYVNLGRAWSEAFNNEEEGDPDDDTYLDGPREEMSEVSRITSAWMRAEAAEAKKARVAVEKTIA